MNIQGGQQFGNYQLIKSLGQGSFAEVYQAKHIYLDTLAAIKILHIQVSNETMTEFQSEARTVAHLSHPNIVRVLEFGIEKATPFLVMEYAPNGTLRTRHPKGTTLPSEVVLSYVKRLAEALQYAHNEKIIHRDLKPENVLINANGAILLSDFGIAVLAHSSRSQNSYGMAGTAPYMAPEQLQGKPNFASDQYALGIMTYEWLSGVVPFTGTFTEIASQHMHMPPPPLHEKLPLVSLDVEHVVMTALAKDPQRRFRNVRAFATALENAFQTAPAHTVIPDSHTNNQPGNAAEQVRPDVHANNQAFPEGSFYYPVPSINSNQTPPPPPGYTPYSNNPANPSVPNYPAYPPNPAGLSSPDQVSANKTGNNPSLPIKPATETAKPKLSRRTVVAAGSGLVALAVIGGAIALATNRPGTSSNTAHNQTSPHPTNTPTPIQTVTDTPTPTTDTTTPPAPNASGATVILNQPTYNVKDHLQAIYSVAWSPDGKSIASASQDTTVNLRNTQGITQSTYKGHSDIVYMVAWSSDSKYLASCSKDYTVQVWQPNSTQSIYAYKHSNWVPSIAWSPDGKRIASGCIDKSIHVWDALNGGNDITYSGHKGGVTTITWSPDGKYIASGDDNHTLNVWEVATQTNVFSKSGYQNEVRCISWSKQQFIATNGIDLDTPVTIISAPNNTKTNTIKYQYIVPAGTIKPLTPIHGFNYSQNPKNVCWSPDGSKIAFLDGNLIVADTATGNNLANCVFDHYINSVSWAPDGKSMATGDTGKNFSIWKIA